MDLFCGCLDSQTSFGKCVAKCRGTQTTPLPKAKVFVVLMLGFGNVFGQYAKKYASDGIYITSSFNFACRYSCYIPISSFHGARLLSTFKQGRPWLDVEENIIKTIV